MKQEQTLEGAFAGGSALRITKECPEAYAQRRANETGTSYLVTDLGHAAWNCPENRKAYRAIGCTIVKVFRPQRRVS